MEKELSVIPECYVDTNLVNCLIGKSCNHQKRLSDGIQGNERAIE